MISVANLTKDYENNDAKTRALNGLTFSIQAGEFVSIMGPSGSGKSTLLHILSFLDRPTGGTYTFKEKSMRDFSDGGLARIRNEEMGFVFQSFNLLGQSSVYENVEIPLLYGDLPNAERKARIEYAVASVGLEEKIGVEAARLSGGQKQRVAIARALVNNPTIIFADEPTGNLDSQSGGQIMELLKKLHETGRTIILVTHETYTAEFADRIIRLKDGAIDSDRITEKSKKPAEFFK